MSTTNIPPIADDSENPLIWLGKLALIIAASAVLAHFGMRSLPDNRFASHRDSQNSADSAWNNNTSHHDRIQK